MIMDIELKRKLRSILNSLSDADLVEAQTLLVQSAETRATPVALNASKIIVSAGTDGEASVTLPSAPPGRLAGIASA